jgi:hypothetical protein
MARRSLKDLRAHISASSNNGNSTGGQFYPHWKLPKDGQTRIRITEDPDESNPFIVYKEYMEHKLEVDTDRAGAESDWIRVPCIKNLGKNHPCPLCEHSSKLYKAKDDQAGKYYYREMFSLLRGIIIKDGLEYAEGEESQVGKELVFKFSYQLANALKSEMGKLDDDDVFWDLEEGIDFIIEKQMVKGKGDKEYGKYDVGSSFARRPTDASEYEDVVTDQPLSVLIPEIPSYDEAAEALARHFKFKSDDHGSNNDDDEEDDKGEDEDALMEKINRKRRDKKADKAKVKEEVEEDEEEDEAPKKKSKSKKVVDEEDDEEFDDIPFDTGDDDESDDISLSALMDDDDDDDDDDILSQLKG